MYRYILDEFEPASAANFVRFCLWVRSSLFRWCAIDAHSAAVDLPSPLSPINQHHTTSISLTRTRLDNVQSASYVCSQPMASAARLDCTSHATWPMEGISYVYVPHPSNPYANSSWPFFSVFWFNLTNKRYQKLSHSESRISVSLGKSIFSSPFQGN